MTRRESRALNLLGEAVDWTAHGLMVDGWAALAVVCEEYGLDASNKEHQHEALIELHSLLDEVSEANIQIIWL